MNRHVAQISQRLSLRPPQQRSLEILSEVVEKIQLTKNADPAVALAAVRENFPSVTDFERNFPSLCFALATGVGKTRLMGAFIAWLYREKGTKHFFVLAPNLTIYKKLIADFTPNTSKYVFRGISEFANTPPYVITGDNYDSHLVKSRIEAISGQGMLIDDSVHINVFNISKINSESRGGRELRIKKASEILGVKYFEYLSQLKDLVLVMDESHRYRADAGVKVLNELNPVLGLELTATPQVESGSKEPVKFKNVIYSYPLSAAIKDGFVKKPTVATRKDFRKDDYPTERALELLKLEDAVRVHESVKVDLAVYCGERNIPRVKPFILVIAEDTDHANQLEAEIKKPTFFGGRYTNAVITVHSNKKGEEKDEVVERLLKVEDPNEPTEIVIHVNMLKEGWDVTNLYTIVPLRAANSRTLIEQSIGRGLRLPFGKLTGVRSLDRLTIIAHDRFDEVLNEASRPDSVIRGGLYIDQELSPKGERVVVAAPLLHQKLLQQASLPLATPSSPTEPGATAPPVAPPSAEETEMNGHVLKMVDHAADRPALFPTLESLQSPQAIERLVKETTAEFARHHGPPDDTQQALVVASVKKVVGEFQKHVIGVPRITVVPSSMSTCGYSDFDLDVSAVRYAPVSQSILIKYLEDQAQQDTLGVGAEIVHEERLENHLIARLIDFDDIDYNKDGELLQKLSTQLVDHLRSYLHGEDEVFNVLRYHINPLVELIHTQLQAHFWESPVQYETFVHEGFVVPKEVPFKASAENADRDVRQALDEKLDIRSMVFRGFRKCMYEYQKFDSDTERRTALLLEDDTAVVKWLRPSRDLLRIEYLNNQWYEPDFVVETASRKLLIEVKRRDQLEQTEVLAKARAAVDWCQRATEYELTHGGKSWSYLLVPDNVVSASTSLDRLIAECLRPTPFNTALEAFRTGKQSSGAAAKSAGVPRVEFLLAAGRLGVDVVSLDGDDLEREFAHD